MIRKPKLTIACIITFITLQMYGCILSSNGRFDGGNGTEANPYQISTIEQLQAIDDPDNLDKHFIQTEDIDASASAEFQNGSGFKFIGDQENPFTGSYNGNGYTISDIHLHIQKSGMAANFIIHTGMFGYVKNGRILNITIDNSGQLPNKVRSEQAMFKTKLEQTNHDFVDLQHVNVTDTRGIGFLVGYNDGGMISHCNVNGFTEGHPISHTVGGLVGVNDGFIEYSSFEGLVAASGTAGLVAFNLGTISNSFVKARVEGTSGYGLVVVNHGEILDSYFEGEISSTFRSLGIVGTNHENAIISGTYAIGEAKSISNVAGFSGINDGDIFNSYSIMDLEIDFHDHSSDIHLGGIAIENTSIGMIQHSFFSGFVSLSGKEDTYGGITARNQGMIQTAYWDIQSTGLSAAIGEGSPDGATGLTTAQMTGPAAKQNMPEFDWTNIWRTTEDGYPVLRWEER